MQMKMTSVVELKKENETIILQFIRPRGVYATNGNIDGIAGACCILKHYTDNELVFTDKLGWNEGELFINQQESHEYKKRSFENEDVIEVN